MNYGLIIGYTLISAMVLYDVRITQAKKAGVETELQDAPRWVVGLYWIKCGLVVYFFYLNWKIAFLILGIEFVLSALPVLEIMGQVLLTPFMKRRK